MRYSKASIYYHHPLGQDGIDVGGYLRRILFFDPAEKYAYISAIRIRRGFDGFRTDNNALDMDRMCF